MFHPKTLEFGGRDFAELHVDVDKEKDYGAGDTMHQQT
jgi:hypothetical protein